VTRGGVLIHGGHDSNEAVLGHPEMPSGVILGVSEPDMFAELAKVFVICDDTPPTSFRYPESGVQGWCIPMFYGVLTGFL
jgi:hypothetical protein